ncbi:MAG: endonuclease/exonuclease/phosphatase family protein [Candidatus Helarchaeota archaeon]|nr:endonuclease/exonuclease/phosphatase family protein [Candidatus Helarchaeota archaeon]
MNNKNQIYALFVIGLIAFFLIESFYNVSLYITSLLVNNLDVIERILPWILFYLAVIVIVLIVFGSKLIKEQYKIFSLIAVIAVSRLLSQFFITPEVYLFSNLTVFLTSLLFFLEIFLIFRKRDFLNDFQIIMGGIILGLGINYAFYILNISSNLTSELTKLPFTITFSAVLVYFGLKLFHPKRNTQNTSVQNDLPSKEIGLFHFFLGGILFFLTFIWILCPTALAAYDPLNMSYNNLTTFTWVSYGFTYYILVILITASISFFVLRRLFSMDGKKTLKQILLLSNTITCLLNGIALFLIDQNFTLFSTLYLTLLTICGVFTILVNLAFLIQFFSLPKRLKGYFGIFIFVLLIFISSILWVLVSWVLYQTFLISLSIFALLTFPLLLLVELRKFKVSITQKISLSSSKKRYGALFTIIIFLNICCLTFIGTTRRIATPSAGNPTFFVWNIHNAVGIDDTFDIDRIIEVIQNGTPDVVGLNEVDMGALKTGFVDLAAYIAHKLNMYFYYGPSHYKHYGNAILSKYPILSAETFALPVIVPGAEPRSVIRAVLNINSVNWTVFVTHLSTKRNDRLAQVDYNYSNSVVSLINETPFTNVVWMGDFNFDPASTEYGMLNASPYNKFRDTHAFLYSSPGDTGGFDEDGNPHRRIDYIMCSPDLTPAEGQVFCSPGSDHCAVLTRF